MFYYTINTKYTISIFYTSISIISYDLVFYFIIDTKYTLISVKPKVECKNYLKRLKAYENPLHNTF